jgi:REP element-mobilizing transposase RayT
MARPLRIQFPGACYHVTARGNERKPIFRDDRDRERFLERLATVVRRYQLTLHAYVLMRNHYHLLLTTPAGNLAAAVRQLNGVYTQDFNRRHRRVGHLLQGRYKAIVVDQDSYLLELSRYVHLNPIRVGEVEDAAHFRWSSAAVYTGKRPAPSWLSTVAVLGQFGRRVRPAHRRYAQFLKDGAQQNVQSPWPGVVGQTLLGERKWVERMKRRTGKQGALEEGVVARWELVERPPVSVIISQVARQAAVRSEEVLRRHSHHWGRSVAMWLAWELSGKSQREIGRAFAVGAFAVSKGIRRAEEMKAADRRVARVIRAILTTFRT